MRNTAHDLIPLSRRAILQSGALFVLASTSGGIVRAMPPTDTEAVQGVENIMDDRVVLKVGLFTDPHSADKDTVGTRFYRLSADRVAKAVEHFNTVKCDFVVELGDIVDRAEVEEEIEFLKDIESVYAKFNGERYYVLGNHCVDTLTKDEFIAYTAMPEPFYSFDREGFHFVVLDACFRSDGEPYGRRNAEWRDANIPEEELKWLASDLKENAKPTIVFAHQRLDVDTDYGVNNQEEVRKILEANNSGHTLAVLQGHNHLNDLKEINGISYVTLNAVVDGGDETDNAYSVLNIHRNGTLVIEGFANQQNHEIAR